MFLFCPWYDFKLFCCFFHFSYFKKCLLFACFNVTSYKRNALLFMFIPLEIIYRLCFNYNLGTIVLVSLQAWLRIKIIIWDNLKVLKCTVIHFCTINIRTSFSLCTSWLKIMILHDIKQNHNYLFDKNSIKEFGNKVEPK